MGTSVGQRPCPFLLGLSGDHSPSFTSLGWSLPGQKKEGSEREWRERPEPGRIYEWRSGLRADSATPGGRRGASRPGGFPES